MGAAALVVGNDLRVGTAAQMGPGFVPHAIGWILIALGAAIAVKGFARDAERVVRLHLRPASLIVLSVVVFALLLQSAVLIPAMIAMIGISAPAAGEVRAWETVGIAVFLILLLRRDLQSHAGNVVSGDCRNLVNGHPGRNRWRLPSRLP
jgi:hypothetical protein